MRIVRLIADGELPCRNHTRGCLQVSAEPRTLFVLVVDECHWGIVQYKAHDCMVNPVSVEGRDRRLVDELLQSPNLVSLLVSATPENVLTRDTRIPEIRIVRGEDGSERHKCIVRPASRNEPALALDLEDVLNPSEGSPNLQRLQFDTDELDELNVFRWRRVPGYNVGTGERLHPTRTVQSVHVRIVRRRVSNTSSRRCDRRTDRSTSFVKMSSSTISCSSSIPPYLILRMLVCVRPVRSHLNLLITM